MSAKTAELHALILSKVLVKVLACGVCHSDLNVQQGTYFNPFPMIPGHECIGDIVAIGEGEKTWKIGDRVGAAWHGGHCGERTTTILTLFRIH